MPPSLSTTLSDPLPKPGSSIGRMRSVLRDSGRRWLIIAPGIAVLALAAGLAYYEAIYLPAHAVKPETLQTATARRGDITLSASGTGTLQAANQIDLAFRTTGKLTKLYVNVGDQVSEGQLLAELENTSQKLQYQQAKNNLEDLTSISAIGSAQKSLAQATQTLISAQLQVEYLISPEVYYWENQVAKDEQGLKDAQAAAEAAPLDAAAQDKLKKAKDLLGFAQDQLTAAHKDYHEYVLDTFTVNNIDPVTKKPETYIAYAYKAEILKARQDVIIAQGALTDAQNLYTALTGGKLPAGASGAGLIALEQAQLDLKAAQDKLQATQLVAPFSGTVVAVTSPLGPVSAIPTPVGNTSTTLPVRSTAIMTIADLSKLYVQTYVDPSDFALFKVGNQADVVFDALPDHTFTGKVAHVDPALVTSSGSSAVSGLVELDPTTTSVLLGMTASVNVISAQTLNAVVVPLAALHEYAPGKYTVFVMRNGQPQVQNVEVGLEDLVNAEIKSGLQPGDVVTTGLLVVK